MLVFEDACRRAGLSISEVHRIARGLERYAMQAHKLGLQVYGGTLGLQVYGGTHGSLRFTDNRGSRPLIVAASIRGSRHGGDSGCSPDEEGLLRGE
jgi:hypothetical protein